MYPRKGLWGNFLCHQLNRAQSEEWALRGKETQKGDWLKVKSTAAVNHKIRRETETKTYTHTHTHTDQNQSPILGQCHYGNSWIYRKIILINRYLWRDYYDQPKRYGVQASGWWFPKVFYTKPTMLLVLPVIRKAGCPGRKGIWFLHWLHRSVGLGFATTEVFL